MCDYENSEASKSCLRFTAAISLFLVECETCAGDYKRARYNFYCNNIIKKEHRLNISILILST